MSETVHGKSKSHRIAELEARVAALGAKQPDSDGLFHDRVHRDVGRARPAMTVRQSEPVPEAPSDEAAAIARVRRGLTYTLADVDIVFAALDLARGWEDHWDKEAQRYQQQRDAAETRIRDLEAQLADARSEAVVLRATEENLRSQLATKDTERADAVVLAEMYRQRCREAAQTLIEEIGASGPEGLDATAYRAVGVIAHLRAQLAARTGASPATPLGWVNVYGDRSIDVYFHFTEESARLSADGNSKVNRVAVPVYEHLPRPVAPVSDDELMTAMGKGIHYEDGVTVGYDLTESLAALKKLLNRAAVAPDYVLVGACVVDEGGIVAPFTYEGYEKSVRRYVAEHGGTAYRLYRGEPITEATP